MKTFSCATLLISLVVSASGQTNTVSLLSGSEGEVGPHRRTWSNIVLETNRQGVVVARTNSIVELASGLNRWNGLEWVRATPELIVTNGGVLACGAPASAFFADNLHSYGATQIRMPGGQLFQSHLLGLAYHDTQTGSNGLFAEIKDTAAQIAGADCVVYRNAFSNLRGSVEYRYTRAGVSQVIIIESQPPPPETYGMSSASSCLVAVTEVVAAPEPAIQERSWRSEAVMMLDQTLDFSSMRMAPGQAFAVEAGGARRAALPVSKQYQTIEGRRFIFEQLRFPQIREQLLKLPADPSSGAPASTLTNSSLSRITRWFAQGSLPPAPRVSAAAGATARAPKTAAVAARPGFVLDWELVSGESEWYFACGEAVLISGECHLGAAYFEPGAVLKFAAGASLHIDGPFIWLDDSDCGGAFAVLTSLNDDSRGQLLPSSTGQPADGEYGPALVVQPEDLTNALAHVRVFYGSPGVIPILPVDGAMPAEGSMAPAAFALTEGQGTDAASSGGMSSGASAESASLQNGFGIRPMDSQNCCSAPSGLIGWWPANSNVNDIAGANNGILMGGATATATGCVAQAFSFDGTNGYVQVPDAPVLRPTNLTVEAWVKFTSLDSQANSNGEQFIVFKQNTRSTGFAGYLLEKYRSSGDHFQFIVSPASGNPVTLTSRTNVQTGVWYHVAGVRGSNYLQLYLNGKLQAQTNVTFQQDYGDHDLFFGASGADNWDGKLKGFLDEVSLYNRALSASEITNIYAAGSLGKCAIAPTIVFPPHDQTLMYSNTATFAVTAGGSPPLTYQWRFGGTNLAGATNAALVLSNLQESNVGNYSVVVANPQGSVTSAPGLLSLITCFPALDVMLAFDCSWSMLSSNADGVPKLQAAKRVGTNFLYHLNFTNDQAGIVSFCSNSITRYVLSTNRQELLNSINDIAAGYNTRIDFGIKSSQTELTSARHHTNSLQVLVLLTDGTNEPPSTIPFVEPAATQAKALGIRLITIGFGLDADTNTLRSIASSPADFYYATNSSQLDQAYTSIANAICRGTNPPAITSGPTNQSVCPGSTVTFTVTATGTPPLKYLWYKNSTALTNQTSSSLTLVNVTNSDAATYTVIVTDPANNYAATNATLIVGTNTSATALTSQAACPGSTVTFSTTASGSGFLSYVWKKDGSVLTNQSGSSLTLTNVSVTNAGTYCVEVTGQCRNVTNCASLTVSTVTTVTGPTNQSVLPGSTVLFSTTASGSSLSFVWKQNGVTLIGQNTNSLSLTNVCAANAGSYCVEVRGDCGSRTNYATLDVLCLPPSTNFVAWWQGEGNGLDVAGLDEAALNSVTFTNGEVGQAFVLDGYSAYGFVPASPTLDLGQGSGLTIECWVRPDDVSMWSPLLEWNDGLGHTSGIDFGCDSSGAIYANILDSNGWDWYSISSSSGTIVTGRLQHIALTYDQASGIASLYYNGSLAASTDIGYVTPVTTHDLYLGVYPGYAYGNDTFSTGTVSNQALLQGRLSQRSGATAPDSTLQASALKTVWEGHYFAGVVDEIALYNRALSTNEILTAYSAGSIGRCPLPPRIVSQPTNQTVILSDYVILSAMVAGTQPMAAQWRLNGTNLNGATGASLIFTNVQFADAGLYSLWLSNAVGVTVSSNALLAVNPVPPCTNPPSGLVAWWQAESNTLDVVGGHHGVVLGGLGFAPGEVGQAFSFDGNNECVEIPYSPDLLSIGFSIETWIKPLAQVSDPINQDFIFGQSFARQLVVRTGATGLRVALMIGTGGYSLTDIASVSEVPIGQFSHLVGTWDGTHLRLYINGVLNAQSTPGVSQVDTSCPFWIGGSYAPTGGCAYIGQFFNGLIDEVSYYNRALGEAEIATLYHRHTSGKCSEPPAITLQPTNQTSCPGGSVTFTAAASGTGLLSYQWTFNNFALTGATNSSLILPSVQTNNAGTYAVVVTNALGATLSSNVTLTVWTNISATALTNQTVCPGSTVVFSTTASGTPPFNYVWKKDGSAISNQTDSSLTLTNVSGTNAGTYCVEVTSRCRTVTNCAVLSVLSIPVVAFISPTNGATFDSGTNITLTAQAIQTNGVVSSVQFYSGTNWLGTVTTANNNLYILVWTNPPAGSNTLTAIAAANCTLTNSCSISITIINPLPTVQILSPTNDQFFAYSPTNLVLTTLDTSPVGTNTMAAFYTNGLFMQSFPMLTPPGGISTNQFLWTNVLTGTYTLTAWVTNATGTKACSAPITNIVVNAIPWVRLENPTNSTSTNLTSFAAPTNLVLHATAADPDGTNVTVQFLFRTNCNGTAIWTNVPGTVTQTQNTNFFLTWTNCPPDTHVIYAVASDRNASSASDLVVFKVTPTNPPPSVWLIWPTNGATFPDGANITIIADATNSDRGGIITNVEFFADRRLLGASTNAPYSITECCWKPGNFSITAKATDTFGASAVTNIDITISTEPLTGNGFWDPEFGLGARNSFFTNDPNLSGANISLLAAGAGKTLYAYDYFTGRAKYSVDGTNWLSDNDFPYIVAYSASVNVIVPDGTNVYFAGGQFGLFNWDGASVRPTNVIRWDGSQIHLVGNGLNGDVMAMTKLGGEIYIGGEFTSAGTGDDLDTNVQYVAKLDAANNRWVPVGNGIESLWPLYYPYSGGVFAMAVMRNELYIGGSFTNAGGIAVNNVARLAGTTWTNLGSGVSALWDSGFPVKTMAVCSSNLYLGGELQTAGDQTNVHGIAIWDGVEWKTMNGGVGPRPNSDSGQVAVNTISVHGDRVFVGGDFTNVLDGANVVPAKNVAMATWDEVEQKWSWADLDGGVLTVGELGIVYGSAVVDGDTPGRYDLYICGMFDTAGQDQIISPGMARWCVGYPQPPAPPTVVVTNPISTAVFTNDDANPQYFTVTATAASSASTISSVDFYANGAYIGPGTQGSGNDYTYAYWSPLPGAYLLSGAATDANGLKGVSAPVLVSVNAPGGTVTARGDLFTVMVNDPPTTFDVLANDFSTTTNKLRVVQAAGSGKNGSVQVSPDRSAVIYKPNANTYGTDFFLYSVTDGGNTNTAYVTVKIRNKPYVAVQYPSADAGETVLQSSMVTISGAALDPDTTVTNISAYVNGKLLGRVSPQNFNYYSTPTNLFFNWNTGEACPQTSYAYFSFDWSTNLPGFYDVVVTVADS